MQGQQCAETVEQQTAVSTFSTTAASNMTRELSHVDVDFWRQYEVTAVGDFSPGAIPTATRQRPMETDTTHEEFDSCQSTVGEVLRTRSPHLCDQTEARHGPLLQIIPYHWTSSFVETCHIGDEQGHHNLTPVCPDQII
jgi:hypothetical protein